MAGLRGKIAADGNVKGSVYAGDMVLKEYRLSISDIEGGHRLTATRGSEVQTIDIMDGVDGFTPSIDVSSGSQPNAGGGFTTYHRITITDANGTKSILLNDGADGKDGASSRVTVSDAPDGVLIRSEVTEPNGTLSSTMAVVKHGKTPAKGIDYFTEEDVEEIAEKASAQVDVGIPTPEASDAGKVIKVREDGTYGLSEDDTGISKVPADIVTAGTFAGQVKANETATAVLTAAQVRNVVMLDADPGDGTAVDYPDGTVIHVYE